MSPQTTDDDGGAETTGDGQIDLGDTSRAEIEPASRAELLAAAHANNRLEVRTDGDGDTYIVWSRVPPLGVDYMISRPGWVLVGTTDDGMAQISVGDD
jgi:hypothetical protein